MLNLEIEIKDLDQALEKIINYPKKLETALYSSVKKTLASTRTVLKSELVAKANLRSLLVHKNITKPKVISVSRGANGSIELNFDRISLIHYKLSPSNKVFKQKGVKVANRPYLKAQYKKSGSFHSFGSSSEEFSAAFIARGKSGNKHVFRRNRDSGELTKLYGPNLAYFMQIEALQNAVVNSVKTDFIRSLAHEIEYRSNK